jgi:hypothetical protein
MISFSIRGFTEQTIHFSGLSTEALQSLGLEKEKRCA